MRAAVLVTGARSDPENPIDWKPAIAAAFKNHGIIPKGGGSILIHGDCSGVDTQAGTVGYFADMIVIPMPAQWEEYGKMAGPNRNRQMVKVLTALSDTGYKPFVFAFHDNIESSKGTKRMIEIAGNYGYDVPIYPSDYRG